MNPILLTLIIVASVIVLFFLTTYICYAVVFKTTDKQKKYENTSLPNEKIYLQFNEQISTWVKETRSILHENIEIKSFDSLTLCGKFYEYEKGAPIEIMFHGYRGNSERDLAGGVQRCFALKRSALVVDQRGHGRSDGHTIYFGAKEKYDVLSWANYAYDRFGDSVPLLITGISMGASTVLLASELELPPSVKGVIADCGYSSAKKIIKKIIKQIHLPTFIFYPLIWLGGKIYGKFDLEDANVEKALKNAKIPVKFVHGKNDNFVPYTMSEENYNACAFEKSILLIDGAGHGLSYPVNPDKYLEEVKFFNCSN